MREPVFLHFRHDCGVAGFQSFRRFVDKVKADIEIERVSPAAMNAPPAAQFAATADLRSPDKTAQHTAESHKGYCVEIDRDDDPAQSAQRAEIETSGVSLTDGSQATSDLSNFRGV